MSFISARRGSTTIERLRALVVQIPSSLNTSHNESVSNILRGAPCDFVVAESFKRKVADREFSSDLSIAKTPSSVGAEHHFTALPLEYSVMNLIANTERVPLSPAEVHIHTTKMAC